MEDIYSQYKKHELTSGVISAFRWVILEHYRNNGRNFPWRETNDPYCIFISEIMLQQTQTSRVIGKYTEFIADFPDFQSLAEAPFKKVLQAWQGLGYNRRALALHNAAREVMTRFGGRLPSDPELLRSLPGIGPYTAGAVAAIAFNQPAVFIDTNIRTVYHYFFFRDEDKVLDREILPLVRATLDETTPREWYYALFDYGVMLKQSKQDLSSAMRKKQSTFKGSDRQIRGRILRLLLEHESMIQDELVKQFTDDEQRILRIIGQLVEEGLIRKEDERVKID